MKKFITLFVILFSAIALTSCFGELESLEWEDLPKSVYYVGEMTDQQFKASVSIKINGGNPLTLAAALSSNPTDLTFTGFDLGSTGSRTITIKYKSVSIYWAYQVIEEDIPSNEVIPSYDWYDEKTSPYTLTSIEDLYGFANIVNGKRDDHPADSFAGKTVNLGANIDLTGKVWEPIGAAPRKRNVPLTPLFDLTDLEDLFIDNDKLFTDEVFNLTRDIEVVKTSSNVANQIYFDVTRAAKSSSSITISICNTYEEYGEIAENRRSFITIKKQDLIELGGTDAERLAALKDLVITKLQEQITAGSINSKYFIAPEIYAEAVSPETDNSVLLDSSYYKFTYSGDIEQGNFFSGTFDGQGHKIIGLSDVGYTPTVVLTYANSNTIVTGYTFGLFGVVNGDVTVKNLTFEDVQVVGAYYDTTGENPKLVLAEIDSVGAAIGFAVGNGNLTLDNVKVLSGSIVGNQAVGGIVGRFYNNGNTLIQNCENYANISLTGRDAKHTGGIAGYGTRSGLNDVEGETPHTVIFKNNTNYGNVTGAAKMAGAMVRYIGSPTNKIYVQFENCRNFGNITGSSVSSHGLVGQNATDYTFVDPVNYGTIVN